MSEAGRGRELSDEWRQSIADAMKAKGTIRSKGERDRLSARRAKLQKDDVFDALDMYEEGVPQEDIAEKFGVSLPSINRIIRGLTHRKWGEEWCQTRGVDSLPNRTRANVKFTKEELFDILDRDRNGETRRAIATIYDTSPGNITQICQGKFYPNWYEEWRRLRRVTLSEKGKKKIIKLSENDVRNILNDVAAGIKQRDIAKKYGVSDPTICDIKEGRTHRGIVR
jgi:DNA invertase Pin-like site-specific DNA recombinase